MIDQRSRGHTRVSVRSHGNDLQGVDPRVESSLGMLTGLFDGLRDGFDLPPAESIEFVIADDLSRAIRDQAGQMIGVEDLTLYEPDRIGGTVVGKTMFRDDEHRRIVIVLDATIFEGTEPSSRALELYLASHEIAHALIGQLRSAGRPAMASTNLPWEISHWLARYVLEEYLADSLAEVVLRHCGHVTDEGGDSRPLSIQFVSPRNSTFVDAALIHLTQTADRIHQYRLDGQLETMWRDVLATTSQILITLAHAQAEADDPLGAPGSSVTSARATEFGPLDECWEAIHQKLASFPLLPTPQRFAELEPPVLEEAGDLILQFWKDLGLTFRPAGTDFHIAVAAPHEAWPNNTTR